MDFGKRSQTQETNNQIIEDFHEVPLSVAGLCRKYGLSESSINKLLAKYREWYATTHGGKTRERNGKPVDTRLMEGKRSISFRHMVIGMAVDRYIREHKLTPTSFGHTVNLSRVAVSNILIGAHDLTLKEVTKIAEVIGVPEDELLQQKEARLYAAG